jgi:hypothetical protein
MLCWLDGGTLLARVNAFVRVMSVVGKMFLLEPHIHQGKR